MRSDANAAGVCPAGNVWRCILEAVSDQREAGVVRSVEDEVGGALEADSVRGGVGQGVVVDGAVGDVLQALLSADGCLESAGASTAGVACALHIGPVVGLAAVDCGEALAAVVGESKVAGASSAAEILAGSAGGGIGGAADDFGQTEQAVAGCHEASVAS